MRRGWLLAISAVVALGHAACARPEPPRSARPPAVVAPAAVAPAAVALVEWQFPTSPSAAIRVHSRQAALRDDPARAPRRPAFYPELSEQNTDEGESALARLVRHAERTYQAYAAGRPQFAPPFLVNISKETPGALRAVIAEGVRIVAFSSGAKTTLAGLDEVVREHPEVLFVVATPHISGNSISVEALDERPSVLSTRGHRNVLLAGCLRYYEADLEAERAGQTLGTRENPFTVTNQPVASEARQVFMMSCESTRAFAEGFGETSAAAPHLASLLELAHARRAARGLTSTASELLAELARVTHRTWAREKSAEVHEVPFFTLDTVLLNARRPLVTERVWWGGIAGHPAPISLDP